MEELSAAAASSSTAASQVHVAAEIDSDDDRPPQPFPQRTSFSHLPHFPAREDDVVAQNVVEQRRFAAAPGNNESRGVTDDGWSCIIVIVTFWFFVSMTMIFGVYGPEVLLLGPNSSVLIKPHPLFVENVKVERLNDVDSGPMLYGFYGTPPLNVVTKWLERHKTSLPASTQKDWTFFFNTGSHIDIAYNVTSARSSSLILIIAKGSEGLAQWLEDPSYPNTTLSWNIIQGTGVISQGISKSSGYYIAVGNLNTDVVEVELRFRIRALLYNTSNAYYRCNIGHSQCSLKIFFPGGNSALLETPSLMPGDVSGKCRVKLTFGPRWITYLGSIGGMTFLMLLSARFFNDFRSNREDETGGSGDMASQRTPLISRKDDDVSSLGSSYDSVSQDDECLEDGSGSGSVEGKPGDSEYNNNMRRLCAICFDAPKDCFFLPCGHCVACYACGMRILEAAGNCPICRRRMKKVRKIYTV